MEIIETSIFTRQIKELISDETYSELQFALFHRPDLGELVPHSGGIRKMRWAGSGRGKRGGIRVIYYWYVPGDQLRMLYAYAKNDQADLGPRQLAALRKIVERWNDG